MRRDPRTFAYLLQGNERQREAYRVLSDLRIFDVLKDYDPALVSTICVGLDTGASDLDIICRVTDQARFADVARTHYGEYPEYRLQQSQNRGLDCSVISFFAEPFEIEIYGEDRPIEAQYGFRHFLAFEKLLAVGGDQLRQKICALKKQGLKTEPAIAQLFGCTGDPYEEVLALADLSPEELGTLYQSIASNEVFD